MLHSHNGPFSSFFLLLLFFIISLSHSLFPTSRSIVFGQGTQDDSGMQLMGLLSTLRILAAYMADSALNLSEFAAAGTGKTLPVAAQALNGLFYRLHNPHDLMLWLITAEALLLCIGMIVGAMPDSGVLMCDAGQLAEALIGMYGLATSQLRPGVQPEQFSPTGFGLRSSMLRDDIVSLVSSIISPRPSALSPLISVETMQAWISVINQL